MAPHATTPTLLVSAAVHKIDKITFSCNTGAQSWLDLPAFFYSYAVGFARLEASLSLIPMRQWKATSLRTAKKWLQQQRPFSNSNKQNCNNPLAYAISLPLYHFRGVCVSSLTLKIIKAFRLSYCLPPRFYFKNSPSTSSSSATCALQRNER